MSEQLVILLHGVGARGENLAGLGPIWARALPDTAFAAPDSPFPFDQGGPGRQWFSIAGVTPENRAARVIAARADFDAVIGALVAEHGFAARLDRVALVGFSQGAIMALDALASGRWPVAAVLAYSGRLATPVDNPARGTPALLIHGDADMAIPFTQSQEAAARLTAAGVPTRLIIEPGQYHGISPQGAQEGARFLAGAFGLLHS